MEQDFANQIPEVQVSEVNINFYNTSHPYRKIWISLIIIVGLGFIVLGYFGVFALIEKKAAAKEMVLEIPVGLDRIGIAEIIGNALSWDPERKQIFAGVFAQMQWAAFNRDLIEIFTQEYDWGDKERITFATQSTQYLKPEFDFLSTAYVPGEYILDHDFTAPHISELLILRIKENSGDDFQQFLKSILKSEALEKVAFFVEREQELLPDLVPLPAEDLDLEIVDGKTLLRFSTIYYNQGKGPLELRADQSTAGIREDIERNVFQRIYTIDGGYRDSHSGTFLWHQEHLHYHFADFITYALELEADISIASLVSASKSTFCVRDVSLVDLELADRASEAKYLICGKELQGISVGWGDTYFYTYPDQNIDLTEIPSGIYTLVFQVNPDKRFEELIEENNTSRVTFSYSKEEGTITVIERDPVVAPTVEHVYEEQVF